MYRYGLTVRYRVADMKSVIYRFTKWTVAVEVDLDFHVYAGGVVPRLNGGAGAIDSSVV